MSAISVDDVRFRYGRGFALGPVSVSIEGPGVTALMGPNGAGKSTLVRLLCGVSTPRSGRVEVAGVAMGRGRRGRAARLALGYVPQTMEFPPRARLREVLHHAAWLRRVPASKAQDAVDRALAVVDLQDRAGDRVRSLSGGMVRRLAVAQAVVHDPKVLVLDEPT
ncbi:MAG: ATP-binding cassette domain-containing protein, partial [Angustibacter sp.]